MNNLKLIGLATAVSMAAACQTAQKSFERQREEALNGDLILSLGVRRLFEDPKVEQVVAGVGNNVKCIRERRVGTHLVQRICRTKGEWDYLKRKTAETQQQDRIAGVCGGGGPISRGDCVGIRGGF